MCFLLFSTSYAHAHSSMWVASSDDVNEWFSSSARGAMRAKAGKVFPEASDARIQELTLGSYVPAQTITRQGISRTPARAYAAPIELENKAMGVFYVIFPQNSSASGADLLTRVDSSASFAQHLSSMSTDEVLLVDMGVPASDGMGAWFFFSGKEFVPADNVAKKYVVGSISYDDYFALRPGFVVSKAQSQSEQSTDGSDGHISIIWFAVGIFALLIILGLFVWIRHEIHLSLSSQDTDGSEEAGTLPPHDVHSDELPRTSRNDVTVIALPEHWHRHGTHTFIGRRSNEEDDRSEHTDTTHKEE